MPDAVASAVRAAGGAMHTRDLRDLGHTPHVLGRAVAAGLVRRVRRSWLVLPDVDDHLRQAVAAGGRITCVSQAARLGLWTPAHDDLHIALSPSASPPTADGLRVHWSTGLVPVARHATAAHVVNVLSHVAHCLAPADALAVWESALRHRLVDGEVLQRVRWRGTVAQKLAAVASTSSDSGIETRFVVLMRSIGVEVRQQVWIDGHPLDAVIGVRLLVQLDGFEHHRATDRRRDLRADARLAVRGYTVLRFDYYQVLFAADEVVEAVVTAMAQGLHLA